MFTITKSKNTAEASKSSSLFSKETSIVGDISCDGDIRVDGKIVGNITVNGKLIVGEAAEINGEVKANNADIYGKIVGKLIIAELLCINHTGFVDGDLYAGKLQIESSATFNGVCHMTLPGSVIDIKQENGKKVDFSNVASN